MYEAYSSLSGRTYALKKFRRTKTSAREVQSFMTELQILKRINHHHCVELVASYTDPRTFGLLISPVADSNLAGFYSVVANDEPKKSILRKFFGCLAHALSFLHASKVRHRDIKPENILVKGSEVYLTDFGISWDWENLTRSTTTEDSAKSWIYCAPEVAENGNHRRNSSSDIWSLGCVYLEMLTVLKGFTVTDLREEMRAHTGRQRFYENVDVALEWAQQLSEHGIVAEKEVVRWVRAMVVVEPDIRVTAHALSKMTEVSAEIRGAGESKMFCGECCQELDEEESSATVLSDEDVWEGTLPPEISTPATSPPVTEEPKRPGKSLSVDSVSSLPEMPAILGSISPENTTPEISFPKVDIEAVAEPVTDNERIDQTVRQSNENIQAVERGTISAIESEPTDPQERATKIRQNLIQSVTSKHPPWPFIELGQKLPALTASSWISPIKFLHCMRSDSDFIEYVRSIDSSQATRFSSATLTDVVPMLHLLLLNGLDVNDVKFKYSSDGVEDVMPLSQTLWQEDWALSQTSDAVPKLLIGFGANLHALTSEEDPWTPMVFACSFGHNDIVQVLLALDTSVLKWTGRENGNTLLHETAEQGHHQIIEILLKSDLEIRARAADGSTPGSIAARCGHLEVIKALIKHGFGAREEDTEPKGWQMIHSAAQNGHDEIVEYLISRGAEVQARAGENGDTPGGLAASYGHLPVIKTIIKSGLDIRKEVKSGDGCLMIHCAAERGHIDVVEYLLTQGANIECTTSDGDSPGTLAAANGHLPLIKVLVKSGLGVKKKHTLERWGTLIRDWQMIHSASEEGHSDVVEYLVSQGADIRATAIDDETLATLGAIAIENEHLSVVEVLVKNGLGIDEKMPFLWYKESRMIHIAIFYGQVEIVKFLIDRGANPTRPAIKDFGHRSGSTPLALAKNNAELTKVIKAAVARWKSTH